MEINATKDRYFNAHLGSTVAYAFRDGVWDEANLDYYTDELYNILSYEWFTITYNGEFKLLLTPLSKITDEDALEVAKLMLLENELSEITVIRNDSKVTVKDKKRTVTFWADLEDCEYDNGEHYDASVCRPLNLHCCDILRSKGYALPFMGLPVEELVKNGWLKLKD